LKLGLTIYDALAARDETAAPHRSLDAKGVRARCPFLTGEGLLGGFEYGDCFMDDARFTLEIVAGALASGAVAVNHAPVTTLLREGDGVVGARVEDALTRASCLVRARVTVVTAGPWIDRLVAPPEPLARLSKGVHLLLPPLPTRDAILVAARSDGRPIFLIPWYGKTLVGTTDAEYTGDPGDVRVEDAEIDYLLGETASVLAPSARWTRRDVVSSYAGVRSLRNVAPGRPSEAVSRDWSLEEPSRRLLVSVGGKFTSARADAAVAVDRVLEILERPRVPGRTAREPLPWAPAGPFPTWLDATSRAGEAVGFDPEVAASLAWRYGSSVDLVHDLARQDPSRAARVSPGSPFSIAEVVHAVRGEMARSLDDVVRRRVPVALVGGGDAASIVARELESTELTRP
jgi:glycerol-3-phosphate dehydrogenase